MIEQLKHECGVAMIRLLKPLDYYEQKYGTWAYGFNKLYLMMEKQHNRGQEGAGIASVSLTNGPGTEYMFREKAEGKDANSSEMDASTPHNVIDMMEEQKNITQMGGTMRLGAYECELVKGSRVREAYGEVSLIKERHRHRYEFNNAYLKEFEAKGMKCAGINPAANLVEIVEIPEHRWYIGTQFHPEYSSTVLHPHPLFMSFVKACTEITTSTPVRAVADSGCPQTVEKDD